MFFLKISTLFGQKEGHQNALPCTTRNKSCDNDDNDNTRFEKDPVNVNAEDNSTVNLKMSSTKQTNLLRQIICVLSMEKGNKVKIENKT
jgi:hypothetical protein